MTRLLALLALVGCSTPDDDTPTDDPPASTDAVEEGCADYPEGATDPMALGEVLFPYRWPEARHFDGRASDLDLAWVPCAEDPDIDWSPFDVLLFVSIPAW